MDKIWLIIKREYITRVMKKSFLLITLLAPLGIGLIAVVAGYFASTNNSEKNIAIIDDSEIIQAKDLENSFAKFTMENTPLETLKREYQEKGYDILVHIPPYTDHDEIEHQVSYYTKGKLSINTITNLEKKFRGIFKDYKLDNSSFDKEAIAKLDIKIKLENALINETDETIKGDKSSKFSAAIATGLSYIMGFLMYMVIFIFGTMVMRSVMEEKINRIVEVMISSVKPFQLLLGKVMGVGLVGLTQLAIWIILIPLIFIGVSTIFGAEASTMVNGQDAAAVSEAIKDNGNDITKFITELKALNWMLIVPVFVVFFFGGYFLYSAMFAAVGSAIGDDISEGQQLTLPIVVPVILAFVMIPSVFNDPNGPVALIGSLFPLFSPIIMPARLPFDPPIWQVALSIIFLILGIVLITWLAARIYRVGIFMYGKKVSFKELSKWIMYKG